MNIFSDKIISWYKDNKRDLPWRDTSDPYHIWISEIILQQTRVKQGLGYYMRFIKRFPSVELLANAQEDEVLKYWQGLGYYSRARNLHKAAKQIMDKHKGIFPESYEDILALSGVGDYTAAAIASFAYNLPYATVDGNVYRVLSRLFALETPIDTGKGKKEFSFLAQELLSKQEPGIYNQAIMEFGALYCTPLSPDCVNCTLSQMCKAYENNSVSRYPKKLNKAKITNRYFNYLFINNDSETYLNKRTKNDVWKNLYEFPLIESDKLFNHEELINNKDFKNLFSGIENIQTGSISKPVKHVLSHRHIFAQFITINIANENDELKRFIKLSINQIDNFPVSRLIELFLENNL